MWDLGVVGGKCWVGALGRSWERFPRKAKKGTSLPAVIDYDVEPEVCGFSFRSSDLCSGFRSKMGTQRLEMYSLGAVHCANHRLYNLSMTPR